MGRRGPELPNEHRLGSKSNGMHIILYADFTSKAYQDFKFLIEFVEDVANTATLYFRYASSIGTDEPVSLQGYGIELSLKNTEYRVINEDNEKSGDVENQISEDEIHPLTETDIADLSLKATFVAKQVDDVWGFLTDLTGNFPSLASDLAKVELSDTDRVGLLEDASKFQPGRELASINGRMLSLVDFNPFG